MKYILILLVGCIDVPDEITHTHTINITIDEIKLLSGRCFEENFSKEEFIQCLEQDLTIPQ
jgi:hypothetical protein